jgi:hypothetical protein
MRMQVDAAILQMALIGYQAQLAEINEKMREIQRMLGGTRGGDIPGPDMTSRLSDAGRKRVVAAQRRRWAAYRNSSGPEKEATHAKLAAIMSKARAARWAAAKAKAASA